MISIKFFSYNVRKKDSLSIKHFLFYLPWVGLKSIKNFFGKHKKFVKGGIFLEKIQ